MNTYPLIIDGNSLVMRHIKATQLGDLQANGQFTGGVYGSLNALTSLIGGIDLTPDSIFIFFDAGVPEFRRELIPTYKQDRAKQKELLTPEDKERCYRQLDEARKMFELLGVVCAAFKNREADDCVAAAARLLADRQPVVLSGDKDLWQVVGWGGAEPPRVWDLNRKGMVTQDNFADVTAGEKGGSVPLSMWLTYRALVGDTSDSIKGALGCGEKRAAELVRAVVESGDYDHDLDGVEAYLRDTAEAGTKLRKFEQAILDDIDRLKAVVKGIDLYDSFGNTRRLREILAKRPPVRRMPFLKFCARFQFGRVTGSPEQYLRPFERAASHRVPCEKPS